MAATILPEDSEKSPVGRTQRSPSNKGTESFKVRRKLSLQEVRNEIERAIDETSTKGEAADQVPELSPSKKQSPKVRPRLQAQRKSVYAPFNVDEAYTMKKKRESVFGKRGSGHKRPSIMGDKTPMCSGKNARERIATLIGNQYFQTTVLLFIVMALYGVDTVAIVAPSSEEATQIVGYASVVILMFFVFEVSATSWVKPKYFNSFYFWLDVIGTLSLLVDIQFIWDPLVAFIGGAESTTDMLALARAGKVVRTGTRTTRALRVLRIVRIFRVVRLYRLVRFFARFFQIRVLYEKSDHEMSSSRLGVRLADLLGKRVIVGMLILLFIMPNLEVAIENHGTKVGLAILEATFMEINSTEPAASSSVFASGYEAFASLPPDGEYLCAVQVYDVSLLRLDGCLEEPRNKELHSSESLNSYAVLDLSHVASEQAVYNVLLTTLLIFLLALSSYLFNVDVRESVVKPIERTTRVIKKLAHTLFLLSHEDSHEDESADVTAELFEGQFIEHITERLNSFFNIDASIGEKGTKRRFSNVVPADDNSQAAKDFVKRAVSGIKGEDLESATKRHPEVNHEALSSLAKLWEDEEALQFFKVFLTSEFAVESFLFITAVDKFKSQSKMLDEGMHSLYRKFVDIRAECQVNISDPERDNIEKMLPTPHAAMFDEAREEIFLQLERDNFPRFRQSNLAKQLIEVKKQKEKEARLSKGKDEVLETNASNAQSGPRATLFGGINRIGAAVSTTLNTKSKKGLDEANAAVAAAAVAATSSTN